ncbi:hypothetical protein RSOLAG22IIIB_11521 [Rhizoctonia solani]|uniref:DUF4604 domain-containing protein n=1 Tax=Rhizoctonia solani TaxID=456999 RepID=A0A0K6G8P1_9AGAM|nr:unnamed protein product [Rhizoctonia solani]CUA74860.1 hypothetical protein RSOLAG22IIIB_11521 [Rhizoctonia solani]
MPPRNKNLTAHQLSSKLQYSPQGVPSFLRNLQAQVGGQLSAQRYGGAGDDEEPTIANQEEEDYDDGNVYNPDWDKGDSGDGRPPIPSRPPVPTRPPIPTRPGESSKPHGGRNGTPSEDEEDSGDEKPQIVVLKEGKHLSAREVEREKRRAQGLSDDEDDECSEKPSDEPPTKAKQSKTKSKTFSDPHVSTGAKPKVKRKIISEDVSKTGKEKNSEKPKKKKQKKETKLLSFGDGDD